MFAPRLVRKRLLLLGLCVATFVIAVKPTVAASTSTAEQQAAKYGQPQIYADGIVTNFKSEITLDQKGNATISETITVYFPQSKHGIYRWIPNEVRLRDSGKTLNQPIALKSVSYYKEESPNVKYHSYTASTSSGNYTVLKIGDADTVINGAYIYNIVYDMKRAVRFQDGYQELYLNVTGDQWELPIQSVQALVKAPQKGLETRCYTGVSGSTESNCTATYAESTYSFETTTTPKQLAQGLTIAIKYPDHVFTPPSLLETITEQLLPFAPFIITLFVFLYGFRTWQRHGKDTPLHAIPPIFVPTDQMEQESLTIQHSLLAMKSKSVATTAELIRLAEKGYLTLRYENKKVSIELSQKQQQDLPAFLATQPASLQTILGVLTQNFQASTTLNSLPNAHTKIAESTKQAAAEFKETPYITDLSESLQGTFVLLGILAAIGGFVLIGVLSESGSIFAATLPISLIISGILLGIFAIGMLKRTKEGQQLYLDLHGLKKYIQTAELKRLEFFNNPKKMIAHFEQILPYAIILQLDKQWTKEFGPILEQLQYEPAWMTSNVPIYQALPLTYAAMSSQIGSSMATISTPPSSGGSSFGGGGGGFSGGGSGGGGGGSW